LILSKLNGLLTRRSTDIGKLMYIIAGPDFGELEGNSLLVTIKAVHSMDFRILALTGMNILTIAFAKWVSHCQRWNMTSGCIGKAILYMST
jgi:hypothetical protein